MKIDILSNAGTNQLAGEFSSIGGYGTKVVVKSDHPLRGVIAVDFLLWLRIKSKKMYYTVALFVLIFTHYTLIETFYSFKFQMHRQIS